ncbi:MULTISPECIES: hypothetical protein [unclassified Aureimonas]|uniref:hypothetical protein n=1 Tax=unclassified Aureimonas TaxID=2615206 RepID=UPI000A8F07DB|nr:MULTISPECIES: hypothetical protein [unclassified Aureimonas]
MIEFIDSYLKSPTLAIVVGFLFTIVLPRLWKAITKVFYQILRHSNDRVSEIFLTWEIEKILHARTEIKENRFIYSFHLMNTKFIFWSIASVGTYIFAIQAVYESTDGDPIRVIVWMFFFYCVAGMARNALKIAMSMALVENLEKELSNNIANSKILKRRGYAIKPKYQSLLDSANRDGEFP